MPTSSLYLSYTTESNFNSLYNIETFSELIFSILSHFTFETTSYFSFVLSSNSSITLKLYLSPSCFIFLTSVDSNSSYQDLKVSKFTLDQVLKSNAFSNCHSHINL